MAFAELGDTARAWELFSLLNPVSHSATPADAQVYKVEPYVMAADIYAAPPHTGRGGWTWYTGAAGWMYRLITESLIGFQVRGGTLRFRPCLPPQWKTFSIHYRHRETPYHITVRNAGGGTSVSRIVLDGVDQPDKAVRMTDDRNTHQVEVDID
jgi:cellobiose phosphorylase